MINSEKNLSSKQVKAIELLAFEGATQRQAATKVGVHENTITNWKKDNLFMQELERANRRSIAAASSKALAVMLGLLSANSEMVRFNAAKDILDRAGYKATDRLEVEQIEQERQATDKLNAILQQLKE